MKLGKKSESWSSLCIPQYLVKHKLQVVNCLLLDSAKQVHFLPSVHLLSENLEKSTWCFHPPVKSVWNFLAQSEVSQNWFTARKTDCLIRDFFSEENQAKKLKLFGMRGARLMLEALRLMMFKGLRGSCSSDKTLHPVNSFQRRSYCSKFILLVQVQYFRSLHLKEKRHNTDKRGGSRQ